MDTDLIPYRSEVPSAGVSAKRASIRVVPKSVSSHTWTESHRNTDRETAHQGNRSRLCGWCDSVRHITHRHPQNTRLTYLLRCSIGRDNKYREIECENARCMAHFHKDHGHPVSHRDNYLRLPRHVHCARISPKMLVQRDSTHSPTRPGGLL